MSHPSSPDNKAATPRAQSPHSGTAPPLSGSPRQDAAGHLAAMPSLQLPPPALRPGSVTTQAGAAGQHVHPRTLSFREMPNKPGEGYNADVTGGSGQVHVFRNLTHAQQRQAGSLMTVHQKYPDGEHRPLSPATVQELEQGRAASGYPTAPPVRTMAYRGGQGSARYNRDINDE